MRATIPIAFSVLLILGAAGCSKDDAKKAIDDAQTAASKAADAAKKAQDGLQ
jgi:hypothetical protein